MKFGKVTCLLFNSEFSKYRRAFDYRITEMTTLAKKGKSTAIPGLRYRDEMAMIEWLWRCGKRERLFVV
jgi:hypothetical protein